MGVGQGQKKLIAQQYITDADAITGINTESDRNAVNSIVFGPDS